MRWLVSAVRWARERRLGLSAAAIAVMFVVGVVYLLFGTLRINPVARDTIVRVHLDETGGLLPDQDVTLRGVPVGRVRSIELTESGAVAIAAIRPGVRIPADAEARVSALSPAGEQYLDFRADHNDGPYLAGGDEIDSSRTRIPVSLAKLLGDLDGTLEQVDTAQLSAVLDELRVGPEGPEKLAAILDGGAFLLSTLDSVLPQTVRLLRNSKVVLGSVRDVSPGLASTATDLATIMNGAEQMTGGYATLLDRAPEVYSGIDALIADNSPTMVALLGNLTTVSQMIHKRVPALEEFFFPQYRAGSALDAVASTFRDGGVWGAVSLSSRYGCDYNLPQAPPTLTDFPEPYLYTYCPNPDPKYLVRGARNAPHPPGEEGLAGPPPGAHPLQRSDPTPVGRYTIPTPFGGPILPLPPPPSGP